MIIQPTKRIVLPHENKKMSRPGAIALLTHIIGIDRLPEIRLYMNGDDHVGAICAFQPLLHIGSDAVGMVDSDTRIDLDMEIHNHAIAVAARGEMMESLHPGGCFR